MCSTNCIPTITVVYCWPHAKSEERGNALSPHLSKIPTFPVSSVHMPCPRMQRYKVPCVFVLALYTKASFFPNYQKTSSVVFCLSLVYISFLLSQIAGNLLSGVHAPKLEVCCAGLPYVVSSYDIGFCVHYACPPYLNISLSCCH